MLDFRYHALSLVAVFLALAIGIVLGVTIGDSLLSEAEQGLRNNLRADVVEARDAAEAAQRGVRARDEFIERVEPGLVRERLTGRRVALVSWGPLPDSIEDGVREAVRAASGRVDSVSQFVEPLGDVEQAIGADRFETIAADSDGLGVLARQLAASLVRPGTLPRRLAAREPERFRGRYVGADAVVYFHAPSGDDDAAQERDGTDGGRFQDGLLDGLEGELGPLVGVEASTTEPSQIGFYRGRDMTTVDSVDVAGGRVALVFALAGEEGQFGFKPTAREPLPDLSDLGF